MSMNMYPSIFNYYLINNIKLDFICVGKKNINTKPKIACSGTQVGCHYIV